MSGGTALGLKAADGGQGLARLGFGRDGFDWPNRSESRFVRADGLVWHVQEMAPEGADGGTAPALVLVHGTGASTHSFADLAPRLARRFRVLAMDLPGHAFTDPMPGRSVSLPGMAAALGGLLETVGVRPAVAVGHSAGAAVLIRMALDGRIAPGLIVSLNGALSGFGGIAGRLFQPLARIIAGSSLMPGLLARRAEDPGAFDRLVRRTGSRVPAASLAVYRRLATDPDHMAAALAMMAGWDLDPLRAAMPRLAVPLVLVAGGRDGMVPPEEAFDVARRVPGARPVHLRGLGHLAHEEDPEAVAALIEAAARDHGILERDGP